MAGAYKEHPEEAPCYISEDAGCDKWLHCWDGNIARIPCNVIPIARPVDLGRIITIKQLTCRVTYRLEEQGTPGFRDILQGITLKASKE